MFGLARGIVRHKVGVVALLAICVLFFTRDGGDKAQGPANPWSSQAVAAPAKAEEPSMIGAAVDTATKEVGAFVSDQTGLEIGEIKDKTADNWENTSEAFKQANQSR